MKNNKIGEKIEETHMECLERIAKENNRMLQMLKEVFTNALIVKILNHYKMIKIN